MKCFHSATMKIF